MLEDRISMMTSKGLEFVITSSEREETPRKISGRTKSENTRLNGTNDKMKMTGREESKIKSPRLAHNFQINYGTF